MDSELIRLPKLEKTDVAGGGVPGGLGDNNGGPTVVFQVNDGVLARWSDSQVHKSCWYFCPIHI